MQTINISLACFISISIQAYLKLVCIPRPKQHFAMKYNI